MSGGIIATGTFTTQGGGLGGSLPSPPPTDTTRFLALASGAPLLTTDDRMLELAA